MVTIKEAEMQTGITKQNIRYYEKIGLLQPLREQENKYRNYSEEDIRRLKLIFLFRKLDMPLEEIAYRLNYTDAACFCKVFHRDTGMIPNQYRKQVLR